MDAALIPSTVTPLPIFSLTPTMDSTITPWKTNRPTMTPKPTSIPSATLPVSTPAYLGTTIPADAEVISKDNFLRLTNVAQWGRGTILGVAFTPNGNHFVAGSAYGYAIYDIQDLQKPPVWVAFNQPIQYTLLTFSQDGNYLRLAGKKGQDVILEFPSGQTVEDVEEMEWMDSVVSSDGWDSLVLDSPDGRKQLKAHAIPVEGNWDVLSSIREVFDKASGELLYTLSGETFYVRYYDVNQPESCDLKSTVMCGNAFSPSAFLPYQAAFSPSGDTLTILYRAPNYGNTNRFSVLRIYDAQYGKLLDAIGNLETPIQTFAYAPDGKKMAMAFVDGSIQLWDMARHRFTAGAWHFNDILNFGEFTSDGRYLLLRRPDMLEVRSAVDGSLRSRIKMVEYALSPIDRNVIAIADPDHMIKVMELDSGKVILRIPAHENPIFSVVFSPDGNYLASSGQDCKVKLWDAHTGDFLHYFEETIANGFGEDPLVSDEWNSRIFIYALKFIEGTNQVVGFGSWGTMVSWNLHSGATNYVVYSAPLEFYQGMSTISPHYPDSFGVDVEKQQFAIGRQIYDLHTGEELGEYQSPDNVPDDCASGGWISLNKDLLFTLGYGKKSGQVCILDAQDHSLLQLLTVVPDADYDFSLAGLALSNDGKTLIAATKMGTVHVYQIAR